MPHIRRGSRILFVVFYSVCCKVNCNLLRSKSKDEQVIQLDNFPTDNGNHLQVNLVPENASPSDTRVIHGTFTGSFRNSFDGPLSFVPTKEQQPTATEYKFDARVPLYATFPPGMLVHNTIETDVIQEPESDFSVVTVKNENNAPMRESILRSSMRDLIREPNLHVMGHDTSRLVGLLDAPMPATERLNKYTSDNK